jgi:uncharacterized protein YuzE
MKGATMQEPIELRVDLEVGAAYVAFRHLEDGELVTQATRLDQDVVIQYDRDGRVIGIELIQILSESIESAASFAAQNGLGFPPLREFIRNHAPTDVVGTPVRGVMAG